MRKSLRRSKWTLMGSSGGELGLITTRVETSQPAPGLDGWMGANTRGLSPKKTGKAVQGLLVKADVPKRSQVCSLVTSLLAACLGKTNLTVGIVGGVFASRAASKTYLFSGSG